MLQSPAARVGNLQLISVAERRYAQFPRFAALAGLAHAYSTRPDDVSARQDERAPQRAARRAVMARDLGFDPERLAHTIQVHEPRIAHIEESSRCGAYDGFDGLFTASPGTPLMTFSADCPLILIFDPRCRAVGMVHSSWRCTMARAVTILVEQMRAHLGCRPGDLLASIGPSAGPEQYEVGDDVFHAAAALDDLPVAREQFFPRTRSGKMTFDLWTANRAQLRAAGVRAENIEMAEVCTMTHTDVFYSFRREGAGCGHFGLMAGLLPK